MNAPPDPAADPSPSVVRVAAGERLFRQGEASDAVYLLEDGQVGIHQIIDGHHVELESIGPGEIFGEMAVLDRSHRMATAVAARDSVVIRMPVEVFHGRLSSADRFVRALVGMVARNIRESHRFFLRRPRSFRDHVRQIAAFTDNIRRFATKVDDHEIAKDMHATLDRLDTVLAELNLLVARCPDRRQDIVVAAEELAGVGLDQVVGSESRRRMSAARP